MKAAELREKTVEQLNEELVSLLRDQYDFRMKKALGEFSQSHLLKQTRRDIARIKTVLNEKAGI